MDMGATPPRKRGPHGTVTMPIINGRWWPQSLRHCRAPYPAALHALIKPPGCAGRRLKSSTPCGRFACRPHGRWRSPG